MAPSANSFSLIIILIALSLLPSSLSQCSSQTFSSNRLYSTCNDLPQLSASLHYTFDPSASTLALAFVAPPAGSDGWIAWAINPTATGMIGSQTLIAFRQSDGNMGVKTYNITEYGPIQEGPIGFRVTGLEAEYSDGVMRIFGEVELEKGVTAVNQVWQVGSTVVGGVPGKHAFGAANLAAKGRLDLVKGVSSGNGGGGVSRLKKKNVSTSNCLLF